MQFTIRVRDDKTGAEWDEEYNKPEVRDQASAEAKGREIVAYFNSTLREWESPRTMLYATFGAGDAAQSHDWYKTNLVTVMARGRAYDTAECSRCGITGKRFGISEVKRDSQYKAKGYGSCDSAQVLLARRKAKANPV